MAKIQSYEQVDPSEMHRQVVRQLKHQVPGHEEDGRVKLFKNGFHGVYPIWKILKSRLIANPVMQAPVVPWMDLKHALVEEFRDNL